MYQPESTDPSAAPKNAQAANKSRELFKRFAETGRIEDYLAYSFERAANKRELEG